MAFYLFGCSDESNNKAAQVAVADSVQYSDPRVCEFAEQLAAVDSTQVETSQLRYLNEQWREINRGGRLFTAAEASKSRLILSQLNLILAHESAVLLTEAMQLTAETYDQIEGLRRFSRDPDNMSVPESITRTLVNKLTECCLGALKGNATALVREEKDSTLYNMGAIAYFINRDVNEILRNERSLSNYRSDLERATAALPPVQPVDTQNNWAQCPD